MSDYGSLRYRATRTLDSVVDGAADDVEDAENQLEISLEVLVSHCSLSVLGALVPLRANKRLSCS